MLTRDHTVLHATHMFTHKWNEPYLLLLPDTERHCTLADTHLSWPEWLVTNRGFICPQTVIHPSTNKTQSTKITKITQK